MKRLLANLFIILLLVGQQFAQSPRELISKVRSIKMLESTREDIQRVLVNYNTEYTDDYFQRYYNDSVEIRINFSSGTCDDLDEDSVTWNIGEWKVARLEIEFDDKVALKTLGIDTSKFIKEQMYRLPKDQHIYHDKSKGMAIETGSDGVQMVIFFPSRSSLKKLCEASAGGKDFYMRQSWFDRKLEDRAVCNLENLHADVVDLILSLTEVEATTPKTISVTTVAVDPENDVLTYNYKVSAGRILGNGAKVIWDLTMVPAGTYTIIVGVDDGMGIVGKTATRTVTVK